MSPSRPPIRVRIVGATDVGLIREHNEDNLLALDLDTGDSDFGQLREYDLGPRGLLLVVCDGMGGAAAGEVASSMAVESLRRQGKREVRSVCRPITEGGRCSRERCRGMQGAQSPLPAGGRLIASFS